MTQLTGKFVQGSKFKGKEREKSATFIPVNSPCGKEVGGTGFQPVQKTW
jgi:hypothetical protein